MSRRWVAAGVVLVVVAATVCFGWWMRHPESPRWSGYGMSLDRAVVGRTIWMPIYEGGPSATEDRSVTLVDLEPVFAPNPLPGRQTTEAGMVPLLLGMVACSRW